MCVIKRRPLTKDELKAYSDAIEKYIEKNMEEKMSENYIMLNGKRVDLTEEQLEKLGLKVEKENCFNRANSIKGYNCINALGELSWSLDYGNEIDNKLYQVANYCTDKALMQQRALHETLSRLLWRFSMQNDGDKIKWINSSRKYFITYDYHAEEFRVDYYQTPHGCTLKPATEYFYSVQIAKRAIEEVVIPFMKEHPEFVW